MGFGNFLDAVASRWLSRRVEASSALEVTGPRALGSAVPQRGRSVPAYSVLNSGADRRALSRREAIKVSRTLRGKLGIIKALGENTARYSLGGGLKPTSMCEDREWAKRADDVFDGLVNSKRFDVREDLDFYAMQTVILPDVIFDGDAGCVPVMLEGDGRPRLQLFPADTIGDCAGESFYEVKGAKWEEGILRSPVGTPLAYRILKARIPGVDGQKRFWDYRADQFFHIGRTDRICGNRPMPWLYHGDACALNILDLNTLEMAAFRLNSYFAAVLKKIEGSELSGMFDDLVESEKRAASGSAEGCEDSAALMEEKLVNLFGKAAVLPVTAGEDLKLLRNERDPQSFSRFIEYLITDIAVGFGVPPHFIWGLTGLTGPYVRLVLQQADWFFESVADMMVKDFCQPVWEEVISFSMSNGLLDLPKGGANWRRVQWQGPGSMTIDRGRDGKLYLEQIRNGVGRRSQWYRMTGQGGVEQCRKDIEELRQLMDWCDEMGVPHHYYFGQQSGGQFSAPQPVSAEELAEEMEAAQQGR